MTYIGQGALRFNIRSMIFGRIQRMVHNRPAKLARLTPSEPPRKGLCAEVSIPYQAGSEREYRKAHEPPSWAVLACLDVLHGLVQLEEDDFSARQRQDHLSLVGARFLDLLLAGSTPLLWWLALHDDAQPMRVHLRAKTEPAGLESVSLMFSGTEK